MNINESRMIYYVCSIRDSAMDGFIRPFVVPGTGIAIRSFSDEVNRDGSEMAKHPQDYELFVIGYFDERSGEIVGEKPRSLARAVDVLSKTLTAMPNNVVSLPSGTSKEA